MSESDKKWREFWVSMCTFADGYAEIYECRDAEFEPSPPAYKVHLIEVAALHEAEKRIAELEGEIEQLKTRQISAACVVSSERVRADAKDQLLKEAREVIEFYAKPSVWGIDMPGMRTAIDPSDQEEIRVGDLDKDIRGGKRAREALKLLGDKPERILDTSLEK